MIWISFAYIPNSPSSSSCVPRCQTSTTDWDPDQAHPDWPNARFRRRRSCPWLHQTCTLPKRGQRFALLPFISFFLSHISPNIFWSTSFFSTPELRRWFSEVAKGDHRSYWVKATNEELNNIQHVYFNTMFLCSIIIWIIKYFIASQYIE